MLGGCTFYSVVLFVFLSDMISGGRHSDAFCFFPPHEKAVTKGKVCRANISTIGYLKQTKTF